MTKIGNDLIKNKKLECKKLFNEIKVNKLKVDNYSYKDTVDDGLSSFFKEYDDFFAAHETPGCSIDYQLYIDTMNFIGIENEEECNEIVEYIDGKKCLIINLKS